MIQRTVAQVVREYSDQLTNFVHETLNGSMDALDMRRAHNALVRQLGPQAYIEGLREGGVSADEMESEDKAENQKWVTGQLAYVNQFAADTVAARDDDGKRAAIMNRVGMWVASMENIGGLGVMSARKNKVGTWRLGETQEHCRTCSALHGKRHRLSWFKSRGLIPRETGSTTLDCHGYRCDCHVTDDEGNILL